MATAGGGARLTGSRLKFDETDKTQGNFFVNTADCTQTRATGKPLRNKPGELIFMNPALAAGTYRVEVRIVVKGEKALMTASLPDEITVS